MRLAILSAVLATAAAVPFNVKGLALGPLANKTSFPLLQPTQALAALHQKAQETPSAVSFLKDVEQVMDNLEDIMGGIGDKIKDMIEHNKQFGNVGPSAGKGGAAGKLKGAAGNIAGNATSNATCTTPDIRYEWSSMPDADKKQWIDGVKCLMNTPSRGNFPGSKNRWDDITWVHQQMSPNIHFTAVFLVWHRALLYHVEKEMQTVCNVKAHMFYWDETKDAGNFAHAALFTPEYFGTMPVGTAQCVTDGAFAGQGLNIGPGSTNTPHCMSRGANEKTSAVITQRFIDTCNSYNNFVDMQHCQLLGVHGSGHDACGGVMSDVQSSPADPTFFGHHGLVDMGYVNWQAAKPDERTYVIGGPTTQNCGSNCQQATPDTMLDFKGLWPSAPAREFMDTMGGTLCYKYSS